MDRTEYGSDDEAAASEEAEEVKDPVAEAAAKKQEGNEFFKKARYNDAVRLYSEAIELDPKPVYYNNRAAALLMQEQYARCIDDCRKVLAEDAADVKVSVNGCVSRFSCFFALLTVTIRLCCAAGRRIFGAEKRPRPAECYSRRPSTNRATRKCERR